MSLILKLCCNCHWKNSAYCQWFLPCNSCCLLFYPKKKINNLKFELHIFFNNSSFPVATWEAYSQDLCFSLATQHNLQFPVQFQNTLLLICVPESNPLFSAIIYLFHVIKNSCVYSINNEIRQNSKHKKNFSSFILTLVVEFSKGIQFGAYSLLRIWILNLILTLRRY